jgi:hypothetical protein
MLSVLHCNAQSSGLTVTSKPYQWTDDMNRLGITTPEKGLVFEIIIWNNSTQPLQSPYYSNNLWILILVSSTDTQTSFNFRQEIDINNLYLPPNESDVRFVEINNVGGVNLQIGSYTATLTWGWGQYSSEQGTPIEPYPFDFRVMSEQEFQQETQQNNGGTTSIEIILGIGGILLIICAIYFVNKRRKKNNRTKKSKPENKSAKSNLGVPKKDVSKLVEDIDNKLRVTFREKPNDEREVQDAIEDLLNTKEYDFDREQVSIPYSSKSYKPDFTFEALSTALDAKLCNSKSDEKKIIDEINADIPAYKSKYSYAVFVVYDTGFIRDNRVFKKGIEKNNPNVYVTVVKH